MKAYVKLLFFYFLKLFLFPLRILPVKKNRILFTGLTGGKTNEYSCNPMYLCEYMLSHYDKKYEIFWAVSDPEQYRFLEKKGIRLVRHFSLSSFPVLMTAKVIVSNGSYAPWFPFRKSQYFINTWHGGGAYKKIESNKPDANWAAKKRAEICADHISLFVSSCRAASEYLFRGAFLYRGEILEAGSPRNDDLVNGKTEKASLKVRKYFGMGENDRIVLFAPTYRPYTVSYSFDAGRLLSELSRDGYSWHFMRRAHRYQNDYQIKIEHAEILEAGDYPDMQELLCAADVLITDYSSCIWDYSFLYRPCFLFTPDLDQYLKNTGFYVSIFEWPFPICRNMEELCQKVRTYDAEENRKMIEAHHTKLGSFETGTACQRVCDRITGILET